MNPFQTHGMISWPELATDNPEAAAKFYSAVMAWKTEEMPTPNGPYIVCKIGQPGMAGIMKSPQPQMPNAWTYYVTVNDIEQTAAMIPGMGGAIIVPKMVLPKVGSLICFQDPGGAVLLAMQWDPPTEEMGAMPEVNFGDAFTQEGAFSWFECQTNNADEALAFYKELFGWEVETSDMGNGPYHILKVGDTQFGGICAPMSPDTPPHWGAYVTTMDLESTIGKIKENGGTVLTDPIPIPTVGRIVVFQDPTGAFLTTIQYEIPESA